MFCLTNRQKHKDAQFTVIWFYLQLLKPVNYHICKTGTNRYLKFLLDISLNELLVYYISQIVVDTFSYNQLMN